jgi:HAD superfamily hydrolase (TIGR01509 family)
MSDWSNMIKALVFDFDGLILETEQPLYQSWQELYWANGLELPFEKWALNIGTAEEPFDPFTELESLPNWSLEKNQELSRRLQRELDLIQSQPPRPGVVDYLKDAQRLGLKVALASSSSCDWVTGHLERLGLRQYFDCIQARDDVALTKPDPALYQSAVEILGARPEQAIAFEDSPNGILAAKRAGLHCVAVPSLLTRQLDTGLADLQIGSLAEMTLEELVKEIERRADKNLPPGISN